MPVNSTLSLAPVRDAARSRHPDGADPAVAGVHRRSDRPRRTRLQKEELCPPTCLGIRHGGQADRLASGLIADWRVVTRSKMSHDGAETGLRWEVIMRKMFAAAGLLVVMTTATYAADDGMTVIKDFGTKWQNAYDSGDPAKVADLYANDAAMSSGVLGTVNGRAEIEKVLAAQMEKMKTVTITPIQGHQVGNVVWGIGNFAFPNGPQGHYGLTLVNEGGAWHIVQHVSNVAVKP
jgi:ketosteroid isomerase-like protein